MSVEVIPYVPRSMAHPDGAKLCAKHLKDKGLPSVAGWLFITLTVDRSRFSCPLEAYEFLKPKLNYFIKQMTRAGFLKSGQYIKKLEFHVDDEGWPHWHYVINERSYIHYSMINRWWPYGMTDVRRISDNDYEFEYLLKYVCKDGSLPDWLLDNYKRVRFIQTWGIFDQTEREVSEPSEDSREEPLLREKLKRWSKKATFITRNNQERVIGIQTCDLKLNFDLIWEYFVHQRDDIQTLWKKVLLNRAEQFGHFLKLKPIEI